jgi:hypothetical protein
LPKETGAAPDDSSSGPNAGLIAGAVVGSVAGIALIVLAFILGWKLSGKKKKVAEGAETAAQPFDKPELDGTSPVQANVATTLNDPGHQHQQQQQQSPAKWGPSQAVWAQQDGIYYYYPAPGNVAELAHPEARIQELPTDMRPLQELPSSSQETRHQG